MPVQAMCRGGEESVLMARVDEDNAEDLEGPKIKRNKAVQGE